MPEPKRSYNSTSYTGLALRLEKTSSPVPSGEKRPVQQPKESETSQQAVLINRLIDRIKTV